MQEAKLLQISTKVIPIETKMQTGVWKFHFQKSAFSSSWTEKLSDMNFFLKKEKYTYSSYTERKSWQRL